MGKKSKRPAEKKLIKLNLACGRDKKVGFVNVDADPIVAPDLQLNLDNVPWPFEPESVEEIFCRHYLEHVVDLVGFMDECYRVMTPGAKMFVIAPYWTSMRAWQDPYHVREISEATFLYFNKQARINLGVDYYPIKSDFDFTYGYEINGEWNMRSEEARRFAIQHYLNVVNDIHVTLTKKAQAKS